MRFMINGKEHRAEGVAEVESLVTSIKQTDELEIWASNEDESTLCALLNPRCGWLMFLGFPEDTGFSSRNTMDDFGENDKETFILTSGQADTYPKYWTFDRAVIFDAIIEFALSGRKPSKVAWHDGAFQ